MKKTKYTEEQIALALRQEEAGTPVADILRKTGVSEATFYRREKEFGGMGVAELRRLRQLEEENHKLKQLVADLSLDKKMLQDVLASVYRLDCQERLTMRRKVPRRHVPCQPRVERPAVEAADRAWAMDLMGDTPSDGRKIRPLTILDLDARECPAIHVDFRPTGEDVVRVLEGIARTRGRPRSLKADNGPERTWRSLDLWDDFNGVTPDFSEPGKPTDNAFIESFNGRVREECLNQHWFLCLDDARSKTGWWRDDSNERRPHGALGNLAPGEFARIKAGVNGPKSGSKLA
jgi:putative transposase